MAARRPPPADLIYSPRRAFGDAPPDEASAPRPARGDVGAAAGARGEGGAKRRRKKFVPPAHRTLAVVLQSMRGERLTHRAAFELKNDTAVVGVLYDVDRNLNVNLTDARVTLRTGAVRTLGDAYLNGSTIRFVLFPDDVDALRSLDQYLDARARADRAQTRSFRPAAERAVLPDAIEIAAPQHRDSGRGFMAMD
ncbi:hypothetical protein M885DRAFT_625927 [Pelagophyceae sp. CCMP2097]|nr:hypothetical protein M885DRAFT_625927 [Pelagophyceae sp. CCMP2097]